MTINIPSGSIPLVVEKTLGSAHFTHIAQNPFKFLTALRGQFLPFWILEALYHGQRFFLNLDASVWQGPAFSRDVLGRLFKSFYCITQIIVTKANAAGCIDPDMLMPLQNCPEAYHHY